MPIFEYRCQQCGHEFERVVFGKEKPEICPNCESTETNKLLSSFAVHSSERASSRVPEPGPCPCGAAQRGMCQAMSES